MHASRREPMRTDYETRQVVLRAPDDDFEYSMWHDDRAETTRRHPRRFIAAACERLRDVLGYVGLAVQL